MTRYINKTYICIPGGEIQYWHLTGMIVVWFRNRLYTIRRSRP